MAKFSNGKRCMSTYPVSLCLRANESYLNHPQDSHEDAILAALFGQRTLRRELPSIPPPSIAYASGKTASRMALA